MDSNIFSKFTSHLLYLLALAWVRTLISFSFSALPTYALESKGSRRIDVFLNKKGFQRRIKGNLMYDFLQWVF